MRKILTLAASLGLAFASLNASAAALLVDNFNSPTGGTGPGGSVIATDNTTSGAVVVNSQALGLPNLATSRTFSIDCNSITNLSADCMTGSVGGLGGNLNASAGNANNGTATVVWTLNSFTLPTPASLFFNIVFSAQGTPTTPNTVTFSFDGAGSNDFTVVNTTSLVNIANSGLPFGLTDVEAGYLAGGGTLTMTLSGNAGWNVTLDQFSIDIPEPTSLALVGLALVGAGVVARRRRA